MCEIISFLFDVHLKITARLRDNLLNMEVIFLPFHVARINIFSNSFSVHLQRRVNFISVFSFFLFLLPQQFFFSFFHQLIVKIYIVRVQKSTLNKISLKTQNVMQFKNFFVSAPARLPPRMDPQTPEF